LQRCDTETAPELAQQALDEDQEDPGRALFILAQMQPGNRDMEGRPDDFERALQMHMSPVMPGSHIYLGRIFDLKEAAGPLRLIIYRAALNVLASPCRKQDRGERGIEQPVRASAAARPQQFKMRIV